MDRAALQRRTLVVLSGAQILSGFGLAAGITVGALLAADLWGSPAAAGLTAVVMTAGAAGSALVIARLSGTRGRRVGLATGYVAGAAGALGVVAATQVGTAAGLIGAFLVYGAGAAANLQARFSGADLAPEHRRATAMAVVLMATTVGAVLGPVSARWSGDTVEGWGLHPLLGPFMVAGAAYGLGAAVLAALLRPDPLLTARALAAAPAQAPTSPGVVADARWRVHVAAGIGLMVIAQAVMIAIMTMTPVHLTSHQHGMGAVGTVIAWHVAAMYVPSPLSGFLVDRWGAAPVGVIAGAVLAAAGVVAAAGGAAVGRLSLALVLLGLGWSLAMVAGSTVLATRAPADLRPRLQGRADALTTLAGASGAGLAGVVAAQAGFGTLALAGAGVALAAVPLALMVRHQAGTMAAS